MAGSFTFLMAEKNLRPDPNTQTDFATQLVISVALGLSAFLTFCALRPRWTGLYAARKRQKSAASSLPDLPDTFFGWIPVLYKISDNDVLASAGLDAFVFLTFFKMALKILIVIFFFTLTVIYPIHLHFDKDAISGDNDGVGNRTEISILPRIQQSNSSGVPWCKKDTQQRLSTNYLWIYVVFPYLFSGLTLYLIITTTKRIIAVRQRFLGTKTSVTDRTIRLSGIPEHLRSEEKVKRTIEELEIGNVESVTLCKNWQELDTLMAERLACLRNLEEAWTVHQGSRRVERNLETLPFAQPPPPGPDVEPEAGDERSGLLSAHPEESHVVPYARERPKTRIWYGFLHLQSRQIDAIDYFGEKLRKIDDKIREVRKKDFEPTPLAFVTLDSTAACQMAVQAVMDPEPMQLLAKLAPAPVDVVWKNTYLSRRNRMIRAWVVTAIIVVLTILWSVLLIPLAGLLNLETISKVWPQLGQALRSHPISKSLVSTGLPTLLISLLNVLVPYLYDFLANQQGMISQADVELSVVSKNFFFTFFNLFVLFTVFGTASNAYSFFKYLGDALQDTTCIAYALAQALKDLAPFYSNLIVLQGLGLFPFRLLEFGSVALYPIGLMGAKTPRDYAELVQPPVFSYGFYLPQTLLIFIICIVYSCLPGAEVLIFFGLLYFMIGGFIYKYQLLYAMDHRQHSTGRAWTIICNRIVVGLVVFQLAMAGQLALQLAFKRAILILLLLVGTIWFGYFYQRTYVPLMKFIALRSLTTDGQDSLLLGEPRYDSETDRGNTVDEDETTGLRFMNPNLMAPLQDVWLSGKPANGTDDEEAEVLPNGPEASAWADDNA